MPDPFVLVPAGMLVGRAAGDELDLPDDRVHHLARVLRVRDGATVDVSDGGGRVAPGRWARGRVELVDGPTEHAPPVPRVHVWQALGKGRKHDEVVRVLTELGVDAVTAITSTRTIVDLAGKAERVRARWDAVAGAACEQARRPWRPQVAGPHSLEDLLEDLGDRRPCLVAHVGEQTDPLAAASAVAGTEEIVLAIGPEGGWTEQEATRFADAGAIRVGLGPTVLRTEHAGTVLASVVLAATGRMRA